MTQSKQRTPALFPRTPSLKEYFTFGLAAALEPASSPIARRASSFFSFSVSFSVGNGGETSSLRTSLVLDRERRDKAGFPTGMPSILTLSLDFPGVPEEERRDVYGLPLGLPSPSFTFSKESQLLFLLSEIKSLSSSVSELKSIFRLFYCESQPEVKIPKGGETFPVDCRIGKVPEEVSSIFGDLSPIKKMVNNMKNKKKVRMIVERAAAFRKANPRHPVLIT
jgi:hypothetical protein